MANKPIKLTSHQRSQLQSLWKTAQPKAVELFDRQIDKLGYMGLNVKDESKLGYGIAQKTLLGMDRGFNALLNKTPSDIKFYSETGYNMMIDSIQDFLKPDWEDRQKDRMINNFVKAVKSVYGEGEFGAQYGEDGFIVGKEASYKASYIKRRLKGLSYDELLYITSKSDVLDIFHFYLLAQDEVDGAWENLLYNITRLRKEYKASFK